MAMCEVVDCNEELSVYRAVTIPVWDPNPPEPNKRPMLINVETKACAEHDQVIQRMLDQLVWSRRSWLYD